MLNHTFTFNGHSSDEFGIKIERFRAFNRSARKYDYASVPGRNGNIYNLQQAWEEISVSYQIWAQNPAKQNLADKTLSDSLIQWNGKDGYVVNGTPTSIKLYTVLRQTVTDRTRLQIMAPGSISGIVFYCNIYEDSTEATLVSNVVVTTEDVEVNVPAGKYVKVSFQINRNISYNDVLVLTQIYLFGDTLADKWTAIMEWLNSADGYARLEDTYDTEHYYQAVFVDATDVENFWNMTGRAVVTFRCRPERFLANASAISLDRSVSLAQCVDDSANLYASMSTSSEVVGTLKFREFAEVIGQSGTWRRLKTADGVTGWAQATGLALFGGNIIENNTGRIARPLVTMTNRTDDVIFQINEQVMEIAASFDEILVDCETEYITGTPEANYSLQTHVYDYNGVLYDFPYLKPGVNYIVTSGADMTMEARMWEI